MILAEKIINERKKNGWSQEDLAEKLGVSRQAISKWESAGSVPDLQRVIQMSELFSVSTDYLLKDDLSPQDARDSLTEESGVSRSVHRVSMEEANRYLEHKRKNSPIIANAVSMCILCPVLLVILTVMSEDPEFHITEAAAVIIGCIFLFGMIAAAIYLFITTGLRNKDSLQLERTEFETEYGVTGMVKERSAAYSPVFARGIAIGVILCIVSVIPVIVAGAMNAPDYACAVFTAVMFVLIAIGVNVIVRVSIIRDGYNALLQEGEFTTEEKNAAIKADSIAGIYWPLATAVYLAWSFLSGRWDYTWIIWPVAGVLFAAVKRIFSLSAGSKQ